MAQTLYSELERIARVASESKDFNFRSLATRLTEELLILAYRRLRKDGAAGVDGVTAREYEQELEANISNLHARLKEQKYKAQPVRQCLIPKGDGKYRTLGLPALEDKIVQKAVTILLEPIYEVDFYDFSYGYRPGKKLQDTLKVIREKCMAAGMRYIIDADIEGFFDNLSHEELRNFLKRRVSDGGILRLVGKWLNAGIRTGGEVKKVKAGVPQGGVISPLLANIYLHYVLDDWFVKEVQPRMKGRTFLIRVADDCVPRMHTVSRQTDMQCCTKDEGRSLEAVF